MKISTRLAIGFGLLILLFIICIVISFKALNSASAGMDDAVNVKMRKYQLAVDMRDELRDMAIAARNLALLTDIKAMQPEWERLKLQKAAYLKNREALETIMRTDSTAAGRAALEKLQVNEDQVLSGLEKAGQFGLDNRSQEAINYLMVTVRPAQRALLSSLSEMTTVQLNNSRKSVEDNSRSTRTSTLILVILGLLSIVFSVVTGFIITRVLMRPLGASLLRPSLLRLRLPTVI